MGAAITGWGAALPATELGNEELAARLGIDEAWIFERTGIRARRVVTSDEETTSSLAIGACTRALAGAETESSRVDLVIVATITPDLQVPATASMVQAGIGATAAGAFDLNAGCAGFLYALAAASAMVEAGVCRCVLVCGADVLSRVTDYSDAKSCVLFGDGAAACVVGHVEGPTRLGPFRLASDGTKASFLRIPPETGLIEMRGREVYRHATDAMADAVRSVVIEAGMKLDDVDLVVAHQANGRILDAVATRLGLTPDRVFVNIERYGNTSAASIPLALAEAAQTGRLHDGDVVALTAFGAGFAWGAGMVTWGTGTEPRVEAAMAGVAVV